VSSFHRFSGSLSESHERTKANALIGGCSAANGSPVGTKDLRGSTAELLFVLSRSANSVYAPLARNIPPPARAVGREESRATFASRNEAGLVLFAAAEAVEVGGTAVETEDDDLRPVGGGTVTAGVVVCGAEDVSCRDEIGVIISAILDDGFESDGGSIIVIGIRRRLGIWVSLVGGVGEDPSGGVGTDAAC
jgi:hypothetical protein